MIVFSGDWHEKKNGVGEKCGSLIKSFEVFPTKMPEDLSKLLVHSMGFFVLNLKCLRLNLL